MMPSEEKPRVLTTKTLQEIRDEWAAAPKCWLHCLGRDEMRVRIDRSREQTIALAISHLGLRGKIADYEIVDFGDDLRLQLRHK